MTHLARSNDRRFVTVEVDGDIITLYDQVGHRLNVPDFAGAITTEPFLREMAQRELFSTIVSAIDFVLGDFTEDWEIMTRWYSRTYEVPHGEAEEADELSA